VINDVIQTGGGRVTGLRAKRKGTPVTYEADLVIDGAGSLSLLQDKADFEGTTFDTNVRYSQFCSAYREIVEVPEPVEWDDALVFKATDRAAGYLWYFPRTATEINAGLGFQMNEEPMQLVEALKRDLRNRPEFEGAEVKDKLGAALPPAARTTRRSRRDTWRSATPRATSTRPPGRHRRRGVRWQVRRRAGGESCLRRRRERGEPLAVQHPRNGPLRRAIRRSRRVQRALDRGRRRRPDGTARVAAGREAR